MLPALQRDFGVPSLFHERLENGERRELDDELADDIGEELAAEDGAVFGAETEGIPALEIAERDNPADPLPPADLLECQSASKC